MPEGNIKQLHCEASLCDITDVIHIHVRWNMWWDSQYEGMLRKLRERLEAGQGAMIQHEKKFSWDTKAIIRRHHGGNRVVTNYYSCVAEIAAVEKQIATHSIPAERTLTRRSRVSAA